MTFDAIILIANPKSRRRGDIIAEKLLKRLSWMKRHRGLKTGTLTVVETERADHARVIAREQSFQYRHPLIVSVSGDGTYHEVVNGIRTAIEEQGAGPVAAVFRAGNGNDHYRSLHARSLRKFSRLILGGQTRRIDLLKLTVETGSGSVLIDRYAHSYIGFGLTAEAALILNNGNYNNLTQLVVVPRALKSHQPFPIREHGKEERRVSSLSFHNTPHMAKYLTASKESEPDDGLFEILELGYARAPRLRTFGQALKGAAIGLSGLPSSQDFRFSLPNGGTVQADGESQRDLPYGSHCIIRCAPDALETLAP